MTRQAIADARSLLDAAWNEPGGTAHRVLMHKALTALCDAVESLDAGAPKLPITADEWTLAETALGSPPNDGDGWWLLCRDGGTYVWARKREGAKR